MGREIRRVPPNWEHPRDNVGRLKPLHERHYETEARRWIEDLMLWEKGEHPRQPCDYAAFFWEYEGNPPDQEMCVPYNPDEFKETGWWQVYETVSEGTPVTPAFATREELIDHLCAAGESLVDMKYRKGPFARETATAFVKSGWAPSMLISSGGVIASGIECASDKAAGGGDGDDTP